MRIRHACYGYVHKAGKRKGGVTLKKRKSQAGLAWADGEERARIEREGRDTTGEGVKPKEGRRAQEGKEGGRGIRK